MKNKYLFTLIVPIIITAAIFFGCEHEIQIDDNIFPELLATFQLGSSGATISMMQVFGEDFMMGANDEEIGASSSEYPQHQITISQGFWISQYEVTQKQWEAVTGESPSVGYGVGEDYPVYNVSWNDIRDKFLAVINNGEEDYPWRLPSEAEWEFACRAGTSERFSFGEDSSLSKIDDYAIYSGNSDSTSEVGAKWFNQNTLYDMHGNVWEWCLDDWHENFEGAPTDSDPWIDSPRSSDRVIRGGGWNSDALECRSASRNHRDVAFKDNNLGFRLVRTHPPFSPG